MRPPSNWRDKLLRHAFAVVKKGNVRNEFKISILGQLAFGQLGNEPVMQFHQRLIAVGIDQHERLVAGTPLETLYVIEGNFERRLAG